MILFRPSFREQFLHKQFWIARCFIQRSDFVIYLIYTLAYTLITYLPEFELHFPDFMEVPFFKKSLENSERVDISPSQEIQIYL